MNDDVEDAKGMKGEGATPSRSYRTGGFQQMEMREASPHSGPTPDEQIRRFVDGATEWAVGLHNIRLAVYGLDPRPRERAEKVLAELLQAHAIYGNGWHGG